MTSTSFSHQLHICFPQNASMALWQIDDQAFASHPGFMADTLEEQIRSHAPGNAAGYYLELHPNDGSVKRYPPSGAFPLRPFSPPSGTPFGTYLLNFVRYLNDSHSMTPTNGDVPYVRIQIPQARKTMPTPKGDVEQTTEDVKAEEEGETISEEADSTNRFTDLELAIASTPAMITARADFEKQRMAMELAENNQELLNKGHFSRDAAEALALNRAYRRESQVTLESQAHLLRRTAEDVQSHWAAFRLAQETQLQGMRLIKEQLELFAKPAPPPPPLDYTPALIEGIKTLRDVGVALIQAKGMAPAASGPTVPPEATTARLVRETPSQLPAAARTASREASPSAAPAATAAPTEGHPAPPEESPEVQARLPDGEVGELLAACGDLLEARKSEPPSEASGAAVPPVTTPAVAPAAEEMEIAPSQDGRAEAARLWRALAETSEVEAMLALLSPEQLAAFLQRLRKRVKP